MQLAGKTAAICSNFSIQGVFMESSGSSPKLPEELTDLIFSNADAKSAINLINVNKKYSNDENLWRKLLPEGFPLNLSAKNFALHRIIKSGEDGIIPKLREHFKSLQKDKNSLFQCAFIKENTTFEECFKNPSVKLAIKFKNATVDNLPENYLFAKEFVPSCITDHPMSNDLENIRVEASYFTDGSLPPFIEAMKVKGKALMMEYVKNNTAIDCSLAETNPLLFNQEIFKSKIIDKIADYVNKNMPKEHAMVENMKSETKSDQYIRLNELVTTEVLKLDQSLKDESFKEL